ncbi:hypothetical protein [Actinoplanes sp. NPDC051859]|uniref:hypothetical protein n=1 Tax=Actinoplanes sp. NPDC051859 TaxID=3363909 RepID=UPI00379D7A46
MYRTSDLTVRRTRRDTGADDAARRPRRRYVLTGEKDAFNPDRAADMIELAIVRNY